jgi:hypothetical protein
MLSALIMPVAALYVFIDVEKNRTKKPTKIIKDIVEKPADVRWYLGFNGSPLGATKDKMIPKEKYIKKYDAGWSKTNRFCIK